MLTPASHSHMTTPPLPPSPLPPSPPAPPVPDPEDAPPSAHADTANATAANINAALIVFVSLCYLVVANRMRALRPGSLACDDSVSAVRLSDRARAQRES
jgi:hypothetical protein